LTRVRCGGHRFVDRNKKNKKICERGSLLLMLKEHTRNRFKIRIQVINCKGWAEYKGK